MTTENTSPDSETSSSTITRRTVIGGAGLGASALTLSACSSNSSESSSSSGKGGLTDAKGPTSPTDVAAASDIPVGGALKATSGDLAVMVTQPTEGKFKAFSAVCTHQGCQLNVQDKTLSCPCHASKFSIEDGSVTGGPAPTALPEYKAETKDGRVIVSPA